MAYKVFTPAEVRSASESKASRDAQRAHTLADTTNELLKTKSEVESSFEETMRRQQEQSEAFFTREIEKKESLKKEVLELEERKRIALSPLVEREKALSLREAELDSREDAIKEREEENEETSRLLMTKLDAVSQREMEAEERIKFAKRVEQGAEIQRTQVSNDSKRLGIQMVEFQKYVEDKNTEFAYKQSELDARENLYKENLKNLEGREQKIIDDKRLITDQRTELERGFAELKRKHG